MQTFARCLVGFSLLTLQSEIFAAEVTDVDDAIAKALSFLMTQQKADGSWNVANVPESTATTSLSVMAFLAAGHVPGSGPYGRAIEGGIEYVLESQVVNGMLVNRRGTGHGPMYDHGIGTLMLSEVAGMTGHDLSGRVRQGVERAIRLILLAQNVRKSERDTGGWRYQYNSQDSDLSVSAWQLLALRAAKDIGCDVPVENIDRAVDYVKKCSAGQGFGYQPGNGPRSTMTAAGILALQVCDQYDAAEVVAGIDFLRRQPLKPDDSWYFYGVYYSAISSFKFGGADWERCRGNLFPELLKTQQPDGSWLAPNNNERQQGMIYATSLAILALTVEYEYLPIYQR